MSMIGYCLCMLTFPKEFCLNEALQSALISLVSSGPNFLFFVSGMNCCFTKSKIIVNIDRVLILHSLIDGVDSMS